MQALTSIEYANTYFETKLGADCWVDLTEYDKTKYLTEATRRIYAINGFKYSPEVIELLTAIPDDLQQACCEVALNLISVADNSNPHIINQDLGISSISFGNDSVSYDNTIKISSLGFDNSIFSQYAQSILDKYVIKGYKYV